MSDETSSPDPAAAPAARRKRRLRWITLGVLVALVLGAAASWRSLAILWCWGAAQFAPPSRNDIIAWNCGALARLGPRALPALGRLLENEDLERAWPAGAGIYIMYRDRPDSRDAIQALLQDPRPRVRGVAAVVLVTGPWHAAAGLRPTVEALGSDDRDVRFFSAFYLTWYPAERFESELEDDAPAVFLKMARALREGVGDQRGFCEFDGIQGTRLGLSQRGMVDKDAYSGLSRLNPAWTLRETLDRELASNDARAIYEEAKKKGGPFWKGDDSSGKRVTVTIGK